MSARHFHLISSIRAWMLSKSFAWDRSWAMATTDLSMNNLDLLLISSQFPQPYGMIYFYMLPKTFFDLPSFQNNAQALSSPVIDFLSPNGDAIYLSLTHNKIIFCDKLDDKIVVSGEVSLDLNLIFEIVPQQQDSSKQKTVSILLKRRSGKVLEIVSRKEVVEDWSRRLSEKTMQAGFSSKYRIIMKIGKGNFSDVYHALDISTGQRVAVKQIFKSAFHDSPLKKHLMENQIRILGRLDHPNLVRLRGVFESDEHFYVVMQLIKGQQLAYKIQSNQKFSAQEIKFFLKKTLEGLDHIHSKGIVHRDIKPQNIVFNEKNEPVIVDFGFGTQVYNPQQLLFKCGTVGFMAPEVLKLTVAPDFINPVSDIFSLGVIFYMMLFGSSPFISKSSTSLVRQNIEWIPDFLGLQNSSFTTGTIDLLSKMLDENPLTRITSDQALSHPYFTQQNSTMKEFSTHYEQMLKTRKREVSIDNYKVERPVGMSPEARQRYLERKLK